MGLLVSIIAPAKALFEEFVIDNQTLAYSG